MRIPGFRDNFYVNSWNTNPDGSGIKYSGNQRNVVVGEYGMQLYARYNQPTCTINYFYVDGRISSKKITETYQLTNPLKEEPIYNEFKGWIVDGNLLSPSQVYPWYPSDTEVTGDVNAYMSAYAVYSVRYDANGGSGNPPQPESKPCSKYVNNAGETVISAEEVQLKPNTFLPPAGNAFFSKWKISGVDYSAGDLVRLSAELTASAKWLYNTTYDITATVSPAGRGHAIVESGSSDDEKILAVDSIQPGYLFYRWTNAEGDEVGRNQTQNVSLPYFQPSEVPYTYQHTFVAELMSDPSYCQAFFTDSTDSVKHIDGQLTRRMVDQFMGKAGFSSAAPRARKRLSLEVKDC